MKVNFHILILSRSTLSAKLAGEFGVVLSTDDFFITSEGYQFEQKKLKEAHKWNQDRAFTAIEAQVD